MLQQSEFVPEDYYVQSNDPAHLELVSRRPERDNFTWSLETINDGTLRVCFSSSKHPLPPYPSARTPSRRQVGDYGLETDNCRPEASLALPGGITAHVKWAASPVLTIWPDDGLKTISAAAPATSAAMPPSPGSSSSSDSGSRKPLYRDLEYRSYASDSNGVSHYSVLRQGSMHFGLGEKAAPLDLSGRGFQIAASDTFGYDSYKTDPLYKHIPFLVDAGPDGAVGLFSTSHARSHWAVGSEIDGLWGRYKAYRQSQGGLEMYIFVGRTVQDVVQLYAGLVGYPMLVPRYMMGYVSGGMKYSMMDAPRAHDSVVGFLKECREHDIPVSAFQLSSGYTMSEPPCATRNVFTWNRHRFPDPAAFVKDCHELGVRILANIKPYVLLTHPEYMRLADEGAFFSDPLGLSRKATTPAGHKSPVARLWSAGGGESGYGSHLDFTSRSAFDWWVEGVKELKRLGIDGMWNDNNEFNMPSNDWQCALEKTAEILEMGQDNEDGQATGTAKQEKAEKKRKSTRTDVGLWGRAMHTELNAMASLKGLMEVAPEERPMVLTRSATAGTMRYAASSWSGDNVTSWASMRGGNALALNAGISLLQCYGHDIGGFEGPQPTPELLVRWIQLGIYSPRFAINCFKTSAEDNRVGEVIEPWMYPETTDLVRAALKRRYAMLPYIYSAAILSHLEAIPPQRWVGWGYERDEAVWTDARLRRGDAQFWFGDALMVGGEGIYEPAATAATVYLPRGPDTAHGFVNLNRPHQWLEAGAWHEVECPWRDSVPALARVGSAIPVGKPANTSSAVAAGPNSAFAGVDADDYRGVEIYPLPVAAEAADRGRVWTGTWYEDDGESREEVAMKRLCVFTVSYNVTAADEICVVVEVKRYAGDREDSGGSKGHGEDGAQGDVQVKGESVPVWRPLWLAQQGMHIHVVLPAGETRSVRAGPEISRESAPATRLADDPFGRRVWNVPVLVPSGDW